MKLMELPAMREQALVGDGDERIHAFAQEADAIHGLAATLAAFEIEGLGNHAHGEHAELFGDLGDHGSRAGSSAAAHSGGHEHHVGPLERVGDLMIIFEGSTSSHFGVCAGAEAFGELAANRDLHFRQRGRKRLAIGIHRDELHAGEARFNHGVHGITAGSAHPDYFDFRPMRRGRRFIQFEHYVPLPS
jgi:hypothetical protein